MRIGDGHSLLGALLAFGVVGWEQVLHTEAGGLPLYQVLHWISDSLLALPLAVAAVWAGTRLANRRGIGRRRMPDLFARAILIAALFAVLLIPGGFIHEQFDTLTQAHRSLSLHTHIGTAIRDPRDPAVIFATLVHYWSDGVIGQVVGLPLALLALGLLARRRALSPSFQPQGMRTSR
jgi:hypothetical protein